MTYNAKKIAKKVKKRRFDPNLEALCLFRILASIGGNFGIVMRHQISDLADIELPERGKTGYEFLDWLPSDLKKELLLLSKRLVKGSFVTGNNSRYEEHYHVSCDAVIRTLILTKARKWASKNKEYIKNNNNVMVDEITTVHFV